MKKLIVFMFAIVAIIGGMVYTMPADREKLFLKQETTTNNLEENLKC